MKILRNTPMKDPEGNWTHFAKRLVWEKAPFVDNNHPVRKNIKLIGQKVGYPDLTFSSNISAWEQLLSQLNISELLLKSV